MWSDNLSISFCDPFKNNSKASYYMRLEHLGRYMFAGDFINLKKCKTVVDYGAGNGYGAIYLSDFAEKVIAVETSKNIAKLRKKIESSHKANIITIEEKDYVKYCKKEKVDLLVCYETLAEIAQPEKVLKTFSEVVGKDGYVFISVPNKKFEPTTIDGKSIACGDHITFYTPTKIKKLIKDCGFVVSNQLAQPYSNTFLNEEFFLINRYEYTEKEIEKLHSKSPDALKFNARLMAYPITKYYEDSYSIIITAKKPE